MMDKKKERQDGDCLIFIVDEKYVVGSIGPEKLDWDDTGARDASCNGVQRCVPQLGLQISPYRPGKTFLYPHRGPVFPIFFGLSPSVQFTTLCTFQASLSLPHLHVDLWEHTFKLVEFFFRILALLAPRDHNPASRKTYCGTAY